MHKLFDTVVIGTSLRPEAEHHVRTAVAFARAGGARIELVHALEPRDVIAPGMEWLPQELWDELRADLQKDLEAQARRVGLSEDEMKGVQLLTGTAHRVLAAAGARPRTIVVLGAVDRDQRRWLGSTAERVARRALRPTLVVRGPLASPPKRVLIPVDFSPLAAATLRTGLRLVGQMGWQDRAPVVAVHVAQRVVPARRRGLDDNALRAEAGAALDHFLADESAGARVASLVLVGDPPGEIGDRLGASDLLVLGTHGAGGFERFLLGSVASQLLHNAPCNVLLAPPHHAPSVWLPSDAVQAIEPLPVSA